jgi:hypothetical protein
MRFYQQQHEFYCGVDLHARSMHVCIVDHEGQTKVHKNIDATPDRFLGLRDAPSGGPPSGFWKEITRASPLPRVEPNWSRKRGQAPIRVSANESFNCQPRCFRNSRSAAAAAGLRHRAQWPAGDGVFSFWMRQAGTALPVCLTRAEARA